MELPFHHDHYKHSFHCTTDISSAPFTITATAIFVAAIFISFTQMWVSASHNHCNYCNGFPSPTPPWLHATTKKYYHCWSTTTSLSTTASAMVTIIVTAAIVSITNAAMTTMIMFALPVHHCQCLIPPH
ncbi:hypothetical protein FRX31_029544 [Thalictrum thalictroides]|uniref:Transmembrane protein n=1 Tax=Thalictrum thalictroides TaxID=46969 RepID=A0A7J6V7G3_THATH|nr:hypothetical protein FRX31_029544 [Thalictrum thalictroides]